MSASTKPAISSFAAKALITGAVIFVVASWLLELVDMVNERESRIEHAKVEIENTATVLREYTGARLDLYQQSLKGLVGQIDAGRIADPAAAEQIYVLLSLRRAVTAGVLQFTVTDANGVLRHSSEGRDFTPLNIAERDLFEDIKTGLADQTFITPAMRGEFGAAKDKWIMVISRRLQQVDGAFAGAVHAAVSIDDFSPVFRTLRMGENSVVGIFHMDGTLMVRHPDQEKYIGNKYLDTDFMKAVLQDPERGVVHLPRVQRWQFYERVASSPLIVFVAASETDLLAPWRASIITTLIEQSALTLLVGFLTALAVTGLNRRALAESSYQARLARLAEATGELMTATDQDMLVNNAVKTVRSIVPSHQAVAYFSAKGRAEHGLHAVSLSDKYAQWRGYNAPRNGTGIYKLVMDTGVPMRLTQEQLEKHPAWRGFGSEKDRHPPMRGWMAMPLRDHDGAVIGVIQVSDRLEGDFDATDEALFAQFARVLAIALQTLHMVEDTQTAAADARMARDELARVFASTSDGIAIFDEELRYTYVNDVFCRITATPREKLLGLSFLDRPNSDERVLAKLKECRATGRALEFENTFTPADGVRRWVEVKMFPVDTRISLFVRDVTERRLSEQKLLEAQRMDAVGRLTGGLAHDFNNMLAVVMGNTEMLLSKLNDHAQIRSAELIRAAAKRGADVISRLLSFARRQPLDPKALDIGVVVREVQSLLRRSLPENVAFEFVHAAGLWRAQADLAQLENVLVNLVINARDALPDGGKVTIEASNAHLDAKYADEAEVPPGQYVLLAVSDTGVGMPPEIAAKAFEPFFTTKGLGKGTGLGLSMVYGFAKQSGGHVRLYSELGQGTTVKLYLPRAQGVSEAVAPVEELQTVPRGTETILLVEDEDMVREFVQVMLTDLGYRVVSHRDAESAWTEIMTGLKPDVLLTDLILPGAMNGRQLAEKVIKMRPGISILYMSGYTENAIVHHGRLDPGVNLLSKPFRRYDLAVKLRAVITARSNAGLAPVQP
ncbi:MAG: PAS domain-containing protein [Rhodospirillaceae bacterium]|nr:PAS domain-containing protein [Rhodospirillaceae bacterium]